MSTETMNVGERLEHGSNYAVTNAMSIENQMNRLPQSNIERQAQAVTNAILPPLDLLQGEPQPDAIPEALRRGPTQRQAESGAQFVERAEARQSPTQSRAEGPAQSAERPAQPAERPQPSDRQRPERSSGRTRSFEASRDGRGVQYQVQNGDNLWNIMRDYRRATGNRSPIAELVRRVARDSGINNPNHIVPGQRLTIRGNEAPARRSRPVEQARPARPVESTPPSRPTERTPQPSDRQPPRPADTTEPGNPTTETPNRRRPGDQLNGRPVTDLDRNINPRLGCAMAVSAALREADPRFPMTNNTRELQRQLMQRGYEAVPHQGPIRAGDLREGDVILGFRPGQMPSHAAIYRGDGRVFENNSATGRMTISGDVNRFNQRMHDERGRFQPNGFESVVILRRRSA